MFTQLPLTGARMPRFRDTHRDSQAARLDAVGPGPWELSEAGSPLAQWGLS